ncbi:MAG TPA: hypothetical protein VIM33_15155 [Gaiellaceae bacterium]
MPAAAKISAQDEATILARHDAGEPLRVIAADYPLSHQALSKRLRRARARLGQERERRPELAGEPADRPCRSPGLSVNPRFLWPPARSLLPPACQLAGTAATSSRSSGALGDVFVGLALPPRNVET